MKQTRMSKKLDFSPVYRVFQRNRFTSSIAYSTHMQSNGKPKLIGAFHDSYRKPRKKRIIEIDPNIAEQSLLKGRDAFYAARIWLEKYGMMTIKWPMLAQNLIFSVPG